MNLLKFTSLSSLILSLGATAFAATQPHVVTITAKMENGKKVWTPAKVDIKEGEKVTLKLVNELPEEHGFSATGLVPATVVPAKGSKEVTFTAPNKVETIKFICHLHPAHVPGEFDVTK